MFSLLATASCPELDMTLMGTMKRLSRNSLSNRAISKLTPSSMHVSHILSLEVMLSRGLELGSHSADCWKHVFRLVLHQVTAYSSTTLFW